MLGDRGESTMQRARDVQRDVVLDGENIADFTIVAIGPERSSRRRLHQMRPHANAIARALDGAVEQVRASQTRGGRGLLVAPELKARRAADHIETGDSR